MSTSLPVIDLSIAQRGGEARSEVARQLDLACSEFGFFYLVGHDVPARLTDGLLALAREFFAREPAEKMRIHMSRGGRAWRGYFPVGGELTSGQPDLKEGLYFGTELDDSRSARARRHADARAQPVSRGPAVSCERARVHERARSCRPASVVADGGRAAPGQQLPPAAVHRRSDGALQDLPLSTR